MIIGFTGKMGSGKSTACQMFKEELGDVAQINFKDCLVEEMKERLPNFLSELAKTVYVFDSLTDIQENIDKLFVDKPALMRALMQNYGTEVRRKDDKDYWVKQWKNKVTYEKAKHVVCDDVRFLNESRAVRDFDGIIIRIVRTDIKDTSTHVSETEMSKIKAHHKIVVGGDLKELREELIKIIESEGLRSN